MLKITCLTEKSLPWQLLPRPVEYRDGHELPITRVHTWLPSSAEEGEAICQQLAALKIQPRRSRV